MLVPEHTKSTLATIDKEKHEHNDKRRNTYDHRKGGRRLTASERVCVCPLRRIILPRRPALLATIALRIVLLHLLPAEIE